MESSLDQLLDDALDGFADAHTRPNVARGQAGPGTAANAELPLPAVGDAAASSAQCTLGESSRAGYARGAHEASTSGSRGASQQQRFDPLARSRASKPAAKAQAAADAPPVVNDMADQLAMLFQEMSAAPGGVEAAPEAGRPPGGDMAAAIKRMGEASAAAALATGNVSDAQSSDNEAVMASFIESMTKVLEGGEEDSDALMNSVMRQLLSKEVLYGPLKEVADQYPEWLAQHESTLTSEERSKYEKQLALIHQICALLDEHGDAHFEELTSLLGQLQDLGQPPQEIVDKLSPELQSSGGLPAFPTGADGGNPECPIQ